MARLVSALARGGCAFQLAPGDWGIWRTQDRRGRMIGRLSAETFAMLEIRGALCRVGDASNARFVWSGQVDICDIVGRDGVGSPGEPLPDKADASALRLCQLQRCLVQVKADPALYQRYVCAARSFYEDVMLSQSGAAIASMNWRAVSSGTRIDETQRTSASPMFDRNASKAQKRLEALDHRLGREAMSILTAMVVDACRRAELARIAQQPLRRIDQLSRQALTDLSEVYDRFIPRPEFATQQPAGSAPTLTPNRSSVAR